jgi:mono/diheme cytochrome c family protein
MGSIRWCLAAALSVVLLGATACGSSSSQESGSSASPGAKLFAEAGCGGCHALEAAGASGRVGPDLDQVSPDVATVVSQVENGGGGMPSFRSKLSSAQIRELAGFVADATHQSGQSTQLPLSLAASFTPNRVALSTCGTDQDCLQQGFGNLAYYDGPLLALKRFAHEIETVPAVRAGCHQIAHALGAGGFLHFHRDAGKAFVAAGNLGMTCWSGYYHGILQRAFLGVPETKAALASAARRLCSGPTVHKSTFVLYQCMHGLGHGLMIYTGYNLPLALRTCDRLRTRWDQSSCTGGVFMENLQTSSGVTSPWVRKSDPLYPCDIVAERDKLYCYLMVTSHVLDVTGGSWRKTAQWCRRAESTWIATCFQSFGRDASGRTLQDPAQIIRLCKLAGTHTRDCIYGAARDITSMDAGARRSGPFCRQVPVGHRATCFNGIGTILGGFHAQGPARRAACRAAAPRRYWQTCFDGARA